MSLLLIFLFAFFGILLGRYLFNKWFNHLSLYCLIFGGLIFFYELKLLPYYNLTSLTWFFIVLSFSAYLFGILTVHLTIGLSCGNNRFNKEKKLISIFKDNGNSLKYSIIFFSLVGLFVAVHRWYVLIGLFGSVESVFVNAYVVYRLNVEGQIKEFIPVLPSFIYVGVFLSGIYTAYKGKFGFLSFLPLLCIVLKELTYFGRGEMLFSAMEFIFTFILTRHLLSDDHGGRFPFSRSNAIIAVTVLIFFLLSSASLVRDSRGIKESFPGAKKELNVLRDNLFITPSVYLYVSSDIGVFNKYLQMEKENTRFGENTFLPFYFLLSRMGIVDKPKFFQKGYFIPMWTNTGTFLRELHADFGIVGITIIPFILGFVITFLWYKFFAGGSPLVLALLVYFFLIIGFSFLVMVTRLNQWYFSLLLILFYLPLLKKLSSHSLRINRIRLQ